MKRPIAVDLFCGAGGMSLGFEQAGFQVVAAVDNDPINVAVHQKNFPDCETLQSDLARLSGKGLRKLTKLRDSVIDVLFGGPPCQGFSLIGKRRPDDERNDLVLHFARLVRELGPRYFVMENVPGLLIGQARTLFDMFRAKIRKAGYEIAEPVQTLNAVDFGVPQRRLRVFVLGWQKGLRAPHYPRSAPLVDESGNVWSPNVQQAIGDLPEVSSLEELCQFDRYFGPLGSASYYALLLRGQAFDASNKGRQLAVNGEGLSGCMRTTHTRASMRRFDRTPQGSCEKISRCFRLARDGVAPTLRAGTGPHQGSFTAARPIHPTSARCITTREAARLHSFPDWFEFNSTKWHGFRQIGSSVPPRLGRAVAAAVLRAAISSTKKRSARRTMAR